MEKQQYRSVFTLIMGAILILVFIFELYAESVRRDIVEFELKNASETLVNYIDDNINHISNLISSFYLPQNINLNETDVYKIQEYTRNWVENTRGLSSIYLVSDEGNVYGYSSENVENFNSYIIDDFERLNLSTSMDVRIFSDEEKVGKIYFSKILLNEENVDVGKVIFEYNIYSVISIFEKLNIHLKNTKLILIDSYGNEIYNSDMIKEYIEDDEIINSDFGKIDEENMRKNNLNKNDMDDGNVLAMNVNTVFKYISTVYAEKMAIKENKTLKVEAVTEKLHFKVVVSNDNFNILSMIENVRIVITIVLMFILCVYGLVMSFTKSQKNKLLNSIMIYIITAIVFVSILIMEIGYINKMYDDYLCEQGAVISESITNSRTNIDSLAMIIIEIINDKIIFDNDDKKYVNFIMAIKENFKYIKNVEILNEYEQIFAYPNNFNFEMKEKISLLHQDYIKERNKSLRYVKDIEDTNMHILYYPYKKNKDEKYLIAITIENKEYVNSRIPTLSLTDEFDYLNTDDGFGTEESNVQIRKYKYIRNSGYDNSLGYILVKDNYKKIIEIYKVELMNVYLTIVTFFVAILMIIISVIVVACRIYIKYNKSTKKTYEEEKDMVTKLIVKAEKDIAKFNKDYEIKDDIV